MLYHEALTNRFFLFIIFLTPSVNGARDIRTVDRWADKIGSDLWELANEVTRPKELIHKYRKLNARVEDKSGEDLINMIGESVGRMLRRKMDAVRCILKVAESAAENFNDSAIFGVTQFTAENTAALNLSYVSGKYSPVNGIDNPDLPESVKNHSFLYKDMELESDSHFYNIPVNTNYSSVHVPTNIFDLAFEVNVAIQWSKALDEVFWQNYRSDPALSWQYFGSSTGILRQYPAMQWRSQDSTGDPVPDLYDCRRRSWFIESATCSKDMVILVDISGSMQGNAFSIGKAAVGEILDTLSNNDFVTVLAYSNDTKQVVPCFERLLVQATPENIKTFKQGILKMKNAEPANLTWALDEAFDILEGYRNLKGCNATKPCTQAIMLVTDGVPGNLSEVVERRNMPENGTNTPVRIFTYLLGRDITNVAEIQWLACANRGYYSHVHTLSEVREQVLKYIDVIARPLVLQKVRHPLIWTHAYADISMGEDDPDVSTRKATDYQKYRLLTSVSMPAYDRKKNSNNMTKFADLLGVAGTDVPLDEINQLTLPFKLGVNGYAFIVSNNGYVILHPDLRPAAEGELKINYNSIDLTEVEIIDDDSEPRKPAGIVRDLREALVNHRSGNMTGVPVKLHYDNSRRVTLESRAYFYAPLQETPFALAIALPHYGTTWIKVDDVIKRTQDEEKRILDYFNGDHWRVHPTWVYCRFHYLEGHEFRTPENETRHFLGALDDPHWYWAQQYEEPEGAHHGAEEIDEDGERRKLNCGRKTLNNEAHYCNKELMQLLVFDARATHSSFNEDFKYNSNHTVEGNPIEILGDAYGIYLRFVATQSGLTRWQTIREHPRPLRKQESSDNAKQEFGDLHRRAVNEPWYKGAIFQHRVDHDSISVTVPSKKGMDAIVTVAYGVFFRDGEKEAAAAVVGFQMPMISFYKRFINVTSSSTDSELSCAHTSTDCYLLDQNGYVVICDAHDDTGKFMGVIEGSIMGSLIAQGVYKPVALYDYQALCLRVDAEGAASFFETPLNHVRHLIAWFFARLVWLTSQFIDLPETWARKHAKKEEDAPDPSPPPHWASHHYPCDTERILYILQNYTERNVITNISSHPSRPFYAQKVPHTNLVLVVVNTLFPSPYERYGVDPQELEPSSYSDEPVESPCHKLYLNDLPRRGLEGCYSDDPLEEEIKECGSGSKTYLQTPISSIILMIISTIFLSLC